MPTAEQIDGNLSAQYRAYLAKAYADPVIGPALIRERNQHARFAFTRTCRSHFVPIVSRYAWCCVTSWRGFWIPIGAYALTLAVCLSATENGICQPPARLDYDHYWPTVLNTIATFVLVFYLNQVWPIFV